MVNFGYFAKKQHDTLLEPIESIELKKMSEQLIIFFSILIDKNTE
jgi:hypothetical protein